MSNQANHVIVSSAPIIIMTFGGVMAFGLMMPVLPGLFGKFTGSVTEQTWWFGAGNLAFAVSSFIASPLLGSYSDHIGRKPILLLAFTGLAIGFFAIGMSTALWVLILARFLTGFMQVNGVVAAYIADVTSTQDRARRYGLVGAAYGAGFAVGPMLGGVLGQEDLRWPVLLSATLSLGISFYAMLALRESLPIGSRSPFSWWSSSPWVSLSTLFKIKGARGLPLVAATWSLAQFMLYTLWALYATLRFGWGPVQIGMSLFVLGVTQFIIKGVLLRRMLDHFSHSTLIIGGLIGNAFMHIGLGLSLQAWSLALIVVIGQLLGAGAAPAIQARISANVSAKEQGRSAGSLASLDTLMAVLASVIATPLLGAVSHLDKDDLRMGLPLFFSASLLLFGAVVARRSLAAP